MSKIICTCCEEVYAEIAAPEAEPYLNEIKIDNKQARIDHQHAIHLCFSCNGEEFELEPEQTFGLCCDTCGKVVKYFDSKLEIGDRCKCTGSMIPCLVSV